MRKTYTSTLDTLIKDLEKNKPGSATELDQRYDLVIAKLKVVREYVNKYLEKKV